MVETQSKSTEKESPRREVVGDFFERLNTDVKERRRETLSLKVNDINGVRLFSEGRLLGLLRSVRKQKVPIVVNVPSILPKYSECPNHKFWNFFINSIHGVLLTDYSSKIYDAKNVDHSSEILKAQAHSLLQQNGYIESGKHVALPAWDRFGHPPPASFLQTEDMDQFYGSIKYILFKRLGLSYSRDLAIDSICEFVYEAFQNTKQHGSEDLNGDMIDGVRFISFQRFNLDRGERSLSSLIKEGEVPISDYLQLVQRRWPKTPPKKFVEITVADCGIGIAAKMGKVVGKEDVYSGDIGEEKTLLLKAFTPTGTSKPSSVAGAGLGLYKVLQATQQLGGLFRVRCGRLAMHRHYISRGKYAFSTDLDLTDSQPYSEMAGTSLSLIFPWW